MSSNADPTQISQHPPIQKPSLPSIWMGTTVHPEISDKIKEVRQRGTYWFTSSQYQLEEEEKKGDRTLELRSFYCFLEEEHWMGYGIFKDPLPGTDSSKEPIKYMVRYGNVFMGDHWITKVVVFPKDHPDSTHHPYQMINVMN